MSNNNETAMSLMSTLEVLPTSGGDTAGERQENEEQRVLPTTSPAQSSLTVSVPLNIIATKTPQKRKRQSQSSPSTLSQTKRKKVTPKATPKGRRSRQKPSPPGKSRRRNRSGIGVEEEEEDDTSELSSDTDDSSVCEFSIHRLQMTKLQKVFKGVNPNGIFSEKEIIENFMKGVNNSKNYKERAKFVRKVPPNQDGDPTHYNEEPNFENQFHFKIVAYVQITQFPDPVLPHLGIELDANAKVCHINKILFYYRPNEIFAITFGQTWQVTQPYSCYDFPCIISGRLTRTDGNYQETRKILTGIVKTARSTKKYSLSGDQLKSIQLNWTKEVRSDCSLYGLREFESESEQTLPIRLGFGLACVRISKNMKLDNLPEILDHFAMIARGKPTFTFPKKKAEKQVDNFPQLRVVPSGETTEKLNKHLQSIVCNFLHGSSSSSQELSQFDFCDKHIEDFFNLERLDIKYGKGCFTETIKTFNFCPTTLQVFSAIRDGCAQLTKTNEKFSTFCNKLQNNLKVEYTVRGSCKQIKRGLFALLEGEMRLDDEDQYYWKCMGQWFIIRDEYYFNVQKAFLDLVRKPDVLRIPSRSVGLPERWNFATMKNVHDYVKNYESKQGFYLPPTDDELVKMGLSSLLSMHLEEPTYNGGSEGKAKQLNASPPTDVTMPRFLFDLMYIKKLEDGKASISIFYIFDRFDAGIRDASTKIRKSVELLVKESPTASTKSLLKIFYIYYCCRDKFFQDEFYCELFPKFADFKNHMINGNVSIVVAFLTQGGPLNNEEGRITEGRLTSPSRSAPPSFERERHTSLHFNEDNVRLLVKNNLDDSIINRMCMELKIPPTYMEEHDPTQLASKVLTLLMEKGYCTENKGCDKPITGKLLKIRNPDNFQLFNDREVNREVFRGMRNNFISQFPGFVHKLECFEIYDSISAIPRLNLHFAEITAESQ